MLKLALLSTLTVLIPTAFAAPATPTAPGLQAQTRRAPVARAELFGAPLQQGCQPFFNGLRKAGLREGKQKLGRGQGLFTATRPLPAPFAAATTVRVACHRNTLQLERVEIALEGPAAAIAQVTPALDAKFGAKAGPVWPLGSGWQVSATATPLGTLVIYRGSPAPAPAISRAVSTTPATGPAAARNGKPPLPHPAPPATRAAAAPVSAAQAIAAARAGAKKAQAAAVPSQTAGAPNGGPAPLSVFGVLLTLSCAEFRVGLTKAGLQDEVPGRPPGTEPDAQADAAAQKRAADLAGADLPPPLNSEFRVLKAPTGPFAKATHLHLICAGSPAQPTQVEVLVSATTAELPALRRAVTTPPPRKDAPVLWHASAFPRDPNTVLVVYQRVPASLQPTGAAVKAVATKP